MAARMAPTVAFPITILRVVAAAAASSAMGDVPALTLTVVVVAAQEETVAEDRVLEVAEAAEPSSMVQPHSSRAVPADTSAVVEGAVVRLLAIVPLAQAAEVAEEERRVTAS